MVMRKGSLFRASKMNYPEIGCPVAAAQHLLPTGWIVADPVLDIDALFELLVKPEIVDAFGLTPPMKAARKDAQLEALRERHAEPRPFSRWYSACTDTVFAISVKSLCDRLRLIFFGNLHQDWTEFVLSDLGIFTFEQVEFSASSRGFRSRRDIDDYLLLHACRERFEAGEALDAVLTALPSQPFDNEWLDSRRQRLLFKIAQHVEKQRDWKNAYALYAATGFPGARARAIRVLEKDGQLAQAFALLSVAEQAPESEAERQHLMRMAPRLRRALGHEKPARRKSASISRLDLKLPMPQQDWWVEGVVRDHLAEPEAPVFYVENALINTLFGLLCWPAIFSPIPGAFFHPFHRGPADLHSPDFLRRRAGDFAQCLARLDDGSYLDAIRATYAAKRGITSFFVAWETIGEELLELALACIPPAHIRKWCERILLDIKENRSGFPDLIQFWPAQRRYRMIEVKGPGDRLQDNQLRWIDYCHEHGMPVEVCYLQWLEQAA
jgi:hypothetical protein